MAIVKRGNKYYSDIRINGRRIRKALSTDLDTANIMLKSIEVQEILQPKEPEQVRVKFKDAVNEFIEDCYEVKNAYDTLKYFKGKVTMAVTVLNHLKAYQAYSKIQYVDEASFPSLSAYMRHKKREVSNNTMMKIRGYLRRFFTFAEDSEWIVKSPANRLKKYSMEKKTPYHFTDQEITKIMDNAGHFRLFYQFMLYTGIRCTDLYEMEDDVFYMNKETKRMYISFHMSKTGLELNVPLLPEAEALIPFLGTDGYLFPGFQGTGRDDYKRAQNWNLMENFKLIEYQKKGIRNHTFRHTFAMNLINKGTPKEVIQQLLGHTSITTTEIYAPKMDKEKLEKWTN
jgi:integrase/recombinase XerD